MLAAEHAGSMPGFGEEGGDVPFGFVEFPREAAMDEAKHSGGVGVASAHESGPAGRALWRGAEAVLEAKAFGSEAVEVGCLDGFDAVAAEVLSQVVADHEQYVRF